MSQVKKPEIRESILRSANQLFSRQGYHATTLAQIARGAGVSPANVYVYFGSKLDILYAIYDPWLRRRLVDLGKRLRRLKDRRRRLRLLLGTLWREIPAAHNGFANNLMQAVSTASPHDSYDPALLHWVEQEIAAMLRETLPGERGLALGHRSFTHVLMMAFDGFVINRHLRPRSPCSDETIEAMCRLAFGDSPARPAKRAQRPAAPTG
jgi:AcrR family transcriptional regulator